MDAQTLHDNINDPCNALNLQSDTHDSMDKFRAWGIEVIFSGDQVCFFWFGCDLEFTYHIVEILLPRCSTGLCAAFTRVKDGDEIHFGTDIGCHLVALPDPRICNLYLAVCRVCYSCGASEIFDQFIDDEDNEEFQLVPQ